MASELSKRLPIYRRADPSFDEPQISAMARELGLENARRDELPGGGIRIAQGARKLEVTLERGYWFSKDDELWNPQPPQGLLPSRDGTKEAALAFFSRTGLLPGSSGGARVTAGVAVNSGSRTALARRVGDLLQRCPCYSIDAYLSLGMRLDIGNPEATTVVDVVGPGAKVGIVFGAHGGIIGMNASWQPIAERISDAPMIPPVPPLQTHADVNVIVDRENPRLVYRAVSLRDGTRVLAPFWMFKVFFFAERERHRSVDLVTKAALYDLADPPELPITYEDRTASSQPHVGASSCSIGASWVRKGNSDSEAEVARLLEQALRRDWNVRFAWRDRDAWESDWASYAGTWADAVDLAFYAGHAYKNGWHLTDPNLGTDKFLLSETVGSNDPTKRLWSRTLKWVLIGACGPLWDDCVVRGHGNAFRWVEAFNGLRLIAGFASSTSGFTGEGGRAFELAARGVPVASAWLRAAREAQPSIDPFAGLADAGRWAAVLTAEGLEGSTFADCLPTAGRPLEDVREPTAFRAIWSPA